jgi:hypothetical protein
MPIDPLNPRGGAPNTSVPGISRLKEVYQKTRDNPSSAASERTDQPGGAPLPPLPAPPYQTPPQK